MYNIFIMTNDEIKKLTKQELVDDCRGIGINGLVNYQKATKEDILESIFSYKKAINTIVDVLTENKTEYLIDSISYIGNGGIAFKVLNRKYEILKELNCGNEIYISDGETCSTILDTLGENCYALDYRIDKTSIKNAIDGFILHNK